MIAVSDGLRIEMNGGSEIAVADGEQPIVRFENGEAAFFVESQQPVALRTENGTVFNVIRHDGWIGAGVAEGEIIARPGRFFDQFFGKSGVENPELNAVSARPLRLRFFFSPFLGKPDDDQRYLEQQA